MTRALLLSEHDLDSWQRQYAAGQVPSAMPYGVDVLTSVGYELRGTTQAQGRLATKVRDFVEHRLGFPVEQTIRGLPAAASADVVIALLERQGVLAAKWRRWRIPPYATTPLVIWSVWLADDIRCADARARRVIRRRIAGADLIVHQSKHERPIFTGLGVPEERLFATTFGVNHRFYTVPGHARDIAFLAVGQDRGRDYATLVEAFRGTDLHLDLVCKPENIEGLAIPPNVRVHGPVSLSTYRTLLGRARVVAVPTFALAYPTGQSVALEASSTGCSVVVTDTAAMSEFFDDGANGRMVPVGDVDGWRAVLTELAEDPDQRERLGAAARRSVEQTFNADHMWTELSRELSTRGVVA